MVPAATMESVTVTPLPTNVEPEPTAAPESEPTTTVEDEPAQPTMQVGDVQMNVPTGETIDPMLSMPFAP